MCPTMEALLQQVEVMEKWWYGSLENPDCYYNCRYCCPYVLDAKNSLYNTATACHAYFFWELRHTGKFASTISCCTVFDILRIYTHVFYQCCLLCMQNIFLQILFFIEIINNTQSSHNRKFIIQHHACVNLLVL